MAVFRVICANCGTLKEEREEKLEGTSHGICLDCMKKLYGHLFTEEELIKMHGK